MKRPQVLLADDHRVVAEGLRSLLEPHFEVAGIVSDGRELLAAAKALDPDVVVPTSRCPLSTGSRPPAKCEPPTPGRKWFS